MPAEWTIEDHLIALATRVGRLKILGVELFTAAIRAFKVLWPEEADPKSPEELAERLMESELGSANGANLLPELAPMKL